MTNFIKKLLETKRQLLFYLFFGVLTTGVNYTAYFVISRMAPWNTTFVPTAAAWALSVLFAYVTNRIWVFVSTAKGALAITREIAAFVAARLLSGVIDVAVMYASVDLLGINDMAMKLLSNVLVVILNYFFSKFFVFKNK